MVRIDNALISLVFASLTLAISYFMIKKNNKLLENAVKEGFKVNSQAIDFWIEENKGKIQRAHSIIGSQGGEAMKLKQGEKLLSQSLIQNSPVINAVLSSGLLSPDMHDWVNTNPELVIQLFPKMQAVLDQITQKSSKEEFNY